MSTPPVVPYQYTPEDLLTMPDGHHFDLVNGHLVERHRGAESSWIAQQVNRHLGLGGEYDEGKSIPRTSGKSWPDFQNTQSEKSSKDSSVGRNAQLIP